MVSNATPLIIPIMGEEGDEYPDSLNSITIPAGFAVPPEYQQQPPLEQYLEARK